MTIRVLIVDDEALVRTGLRLILEREPDLEVVGEAEDGNAALHAVHVLAPDVVLMDIHMKGLNGLEAADRLLSQKNPPKVVMLTTFDHDDHVRDALAIGVSGFLLKDAPREQLGTAVRVAAEGNAMLDPSVTRRVIAAFTSREAARRQYPIELLTDREREVMRLVAQGLSNAEAAGRLVVSEATVKSHVSNALAKLHLRDRTQLAVAAYESGLVQT